MIKRENILVLAIILVVAIVVAISGCTGNNSGATATAAPTVTATSVPASATPLMVTSTPIPVSTADPVAAIEKQYPGYSDYKQQGNTVTFVQKMDVPDQGAPAVSVYVDSIKIDGNDATVSFGYSNPTTATINANLVTISYWPIDLNRKDLIKNENLGSMKIEPGEHHNAVVRSISIADYNSIQLSVTCIDVKAYSYTVSGKILQVNVTT